MLGRAGETFKFCLVSAGGGTGLDPCGQPEADPAGKKDNYFCGFFGW